MVSGTSAEAMIAWYITANTAQSVLPLLVNLIHRELKSDPEINLSTTSNRNENILIRFNHHDMF
jgi:hypothetical protein